MARDEVECFGLDDLDRVEGTEPVPEASDEVDRVIDGDRRQHRRDDVLESGHQAQAGSRDDREGSFGSGEQRWPMQPDGLLRQAGERSDDGAVGEHCFDTDDLLAHGAVSQHP